MLTQDQLKSIVHYDPKTGDFTSVKTGKIYQTLNDWGYITISVLGKNYLAHRLASLYIRGYFPINQFDHLDMVKTNNKWSNLRDATGSENMQNLNKARSDSKTGIMGVTFDKRAKKFRAFIRPPMESKKALGSFTTLEEAETAYLKAKEKYHPFRPQ